MTMKETYESLELVVGFNSLDHVDRNLNELKDDMSYVRLTGAG
jgi:hypothetical protein